MKHKIRKNQRLVMCVRILTSKKWRSLHDPVHYEDEFNQGVGFERAGFFFNNKTQVSKVS